MINELQKLGINVRQGHRGDVKVICPKCSSDRKKKNDPCLSVNVESGIWNCHNCGWKGGVPRKPEKEYVIPQSELKTLSEPVVKWFEGRGISNQTLLRYRVTEGVDYMPQAGKEVRTIHFNYFHNDRLFNIKHRDGQKNFKLVSGAMLGPYGLDVACDNSDSELVICEGEIDAMSFYESGIKTAVSVPNGASKGSQKLEWLDEFIHIFDGRKIYIATDTDEPGLALRNELARRLGRENCLIIDFPRKDANEVLVNDGPEALMNCYMSAYPFPVDGIDDASSVKDEIFQLYDDGYPRGADVGSGIIWHPGQVTLVTGIPGHGKSTFLKNVIYHLANEYDQRFFVYSAEEANTAFALSDMFQIATGKSFFNGLNRISKQEVESLMPFMNDHFKYYRLSDNDLTIEGILAKAKEMVRRYGVNGIVIDNMSTVEKSLSFQSDTRHHQIKLMMNDISRFARNNGVHVFMVAHPKKISKLKNSYEVPNGYDVGDSSHWYNLTDNGLTVYRNMETGLTEVHRWKVRFRYSGEIGVDHFKFDVNSSRFVKAEAVNTGSDHTKFVGQPYGKEEVKRFATLTDSF